MIRGVPRARSALAWAVAVVAVVGALGWEAREELGARQCLRDNADRPVLCAGGPETWLLAVTMVVAVLLMIGIPQLVPPPRD